MSQQETPPEAGGASSTPPAATTHVSDDQLQELLYGYRYCGHGTAGVERRA
jgi:hypothetical protein